jgi:hypothetical protein
MLFISLSNVACRVEASGPDPAWPRLDRDDEAKRLSFRARIRLNNPFMQSWLHEPYVMHPFEVT